MARSRRKLSFPETKEVEPDQGSICSLCHSQSAKVSVPRTWKNEKAQLIAKSLGLSNEQSVCQACRGDIRRLTKDPDHVPRWTKSKEIKCCIPGCTDTSFAQTRTVCEDDIGTILRISVTPPIPVPTPLCKSHYHTIYKALQPIQSHCPTCGSSLKGTSVRTCPDPGRIQEYLSKNTGFEGEIDYNSKVCFGCYKSHLQILKDVKVTSTDSELSALIDSIKGTLTSPKDINTVDSAVLHSLTLLAIHVGETILKHESILLPQVHELFCTFVTETVSASTVSVEEITEPKGLVTARYILSTLTSTLQHHLSYVCKVKKFGTLLYRSNGDSLHALTCALHKSRGENTCTTDHTCTITAVSSDPQAILDLNSRIHQQVRKFLADDAKIPFRFDTLNIDDVISNVDPSLWSAISSLTQSVSERRQTAKVSDTTSHTQHVKKLRRFYCLCALMFCTDDRCYLPVHNLVTDLVDAQGGSTELVKMLNRLGICSSSDTLARSIQYRVKEREEKGVDQECSEHSITFNSVDNVDFVSSFAQVFCGKQSSSWHGTTVQAVQPCPSLKLDSQESMELSAAMTDIPMITEPEPPDYPSRTSNTTGEYTSDKPTSDVSVHGRHQECGYNIPLWVLCRKRAAEQRSPRSSPSKVCRSPAPKVRRRARSRLEGTCSARTAAEISTLPQPPIREATPFTLQGTKLSDFNLTPDEKSAWDALVEELNTYMLQRHKNDTQQPVINIQDYLRLTRPTQPEKSKVEYLDVLDAHADSKDTIMQVLHDLHRRYVEGQKKEWVLVEGDAKVYEILQALKHEYGEELRWMLPFPGDWHMLKNYQIALMKPYFDAGLKHLAQTAGYPTTAIQGCSQFKRTHRFILEAWESLYRMMVNKYLETLATSSETSQTPDTITQTLATAFQRATTTDAPDLSKIISQVQSVLKENAFHSQFSTFLDDLSSTDSTWKFWVQFVFKDALAYISFYLALRSGNWHLRLASMKMMAPVFSAFDHFTYRKLTAEHLADLLHLPTSVMEYLKKGAFVVSITGRAWHSVGVDEAHEMLINKAVKTSVVHPSKEYVSRVASYLPYRTKCIENFRKQLFPEESATVTDTTTSLLSTRSEDRKTSMNIEAQIGLIRSANLLQPTINNRGLINPFANTTASPEQEHDLLQFRSIGTTEFEKYLSYYVLRQASIHPPNRKKRLMTFSERKAGKRTISQLEKDKKLVQKCLHKKMKKWSQLTGKPVERVSEQYVTLPLALANSDGTPRKGQKSYATKALETRYKTSSPPVFLNSLPWIPDCCLLEGMFMLNTTPLGSHRTFGEYSQFLIKRFITPQFRNGTDEVHVIFDHPDRLQHTPKYFERKRRDTNVSTAAGHTCDEFHASRSIPSKWRADVINCRTCKRNLVKFLTSYFLEHMSKFLRPGQMFLVAGGFDGDIQDTAWYVTSNGKAQPNPAYTSNAEETDTRLWLHVRQCSSTRFLIVSPDTDIYHIGLPLENEGKNIVVQISPYNSKDMRYLHLTAFDTVLKNDPDLSSISTALIPQVMQTLYVTSGCDYVSFFCGIGKATFLRYFYQYAEFISVGQGTTPGTLADTSVNLNQGFLAFLRLVGTVYFKKHALAFSTPSPVTLFNTHSHPTTTALDQHCTWLDDIRQTIWDRIQFEDETIPSVDALYRHWKRACWVVNMWHQSNRNTMELKPLTEFGWAMDGNTLTFDWDSLENVAAVQQRVASLIRGCKCRTGCGTLRCGCRKSGKLCSEGCECRNCSNVGTPEHATDTSLHHLSLEEEIADTEHADLADEVDEIMEWVFSGTTSDNSNVQGYSDFED